MINDLHDHPANSFRSESRTRCFAHIVNLVAKTVTHQFDNAAEKVKRLPPDPAHAPVDDEDEEDDEEPELPEDGLTDFGEDEWVDELEEMTVEELRSFHADTKPVRSVLFKVSIFVIIHPS